MKQETFTNCKFDAAILPYLYGDLPDFERSAFESHLSDCTECTDGFAAVAHARYEVYDWKRTDFDPLATPNFAIPYDEVETTATWIDKVRAAFALQWRVPGLAFGGFIVLAALGAMLLFYNDPGYDTARQIEDVVAPVPNSPKAAVAEADDPDVVTVASERGADIKRETRPMTVSISTRAASKRKNVVKVSRPMPSARTMAIRTSTSARTSAPRLNEFSDDEDTSLRLAELFDEIGTRE